MTETRRLYYEDVYKKEFTATVVECREQKKGYAVIVDAVSYTHLTLPTNREV